MSIAMIAAEPQQPSERTSRAFEQLAENAVQRKPAAILAADIATTGR